MSTLQLTDIYSLAGLKSILPSHQKDDAAFLALVLLCCIFYLKIRDKQDPHHHLWFEKPQATASGGQKAETRDIGEKLEESKKDLVIFWGSQSGTAEGLANRLSRDCRRRFGRDALVADLSDYDPASISHIPEAKFAIFIVSTYGEGDPSDNAAQFLSWIESNKSTRLPKLRYAAFGLGNSKYKFYNRVVDIVVDALDGFGAMALMPTGKADDANGTTDEDFTGWKQEFFGVMRGDLGFEERPEQYEPMYRVVEDTSLGVIDLHLGEPIQARGKKNAAAVSSIQALPIKSAKNLLSTIDRNCLHLELDTSAFPELKYKTGDHLAVWPSNPAEEVQRLVRVLRLQDRFDTPLLISSFDPSNQVKYPSPTTWSAIFQHYLEICAPVSRETVLALAQFATSASSRDKLQEIGKDKSTYYTYCFHNHTTLGRLLENISSPIDTWSNLPLSFILESLTPLSPRYYSISSSSVVSPKQISITVATTSEPSPNCTVPIPGLTTTYLQAIESKHSIPANTPNSYPHAHFQYNLSETISLLDNGTKLYAHIRKSKFRLPTQTKTPIIMIASGSGMAPFRGFLAERARLSSMGREVGRSLLFFGCRSPENMLYGAELAALQSGNGNMEVVTAYSRSEKRKGGGKVYVQDRLEERGEEVMRLLLEEGAYFYICGSASMAREVAGRLGECLRRSLGWDEERLRSWSEGMRRGKRWQEDVWG
ncbi:NADPH-cytochrome P450 reductase [Rhexocercosporidium sp. MPI-PUGE-AT-0058]|nr:NADPH-cytochrome P450 reductase [Rhexocercosporidium sp. MPI-PUGE-AT-0058]